MNESMMKRLREMATENIKTTLRLVSETPESIFVRVGATNVSMSDLAPELHDKYLAEFVYANVLKAIENLGMKVEVMDEDERSKSGGHHGEVVLGGDGHGEESPNHDPERI